LEVWEGDITQPTAKMQANGMNSMTVLAEVLPKVVLQAQEHIFCSTREETE
jgi:hypothetical protein